MVSDEAQVKVRYYFSLAKADLDHCPLVERQHPAKCLKVRRSNRNATNACAKENSIACHLTISIVHASLMLQH